MKEILKKAHELTKELKGEFPNINYQAQLGICISFLNKKGATAETKDIKKELRKAFNILSQDKQLYIQANNVIEGETNKAVLIDGGFYAKSQCIFINNLSGINYSVLIPLWLYKKHNNEYFKKGFKASEIIDKYIREYITENENDNSWDFEVDYKNKLKFNTLHIER